MSDAPSAQRAMEATLVGCNGGPGCPSPSFPSAPPSFPASPSRSGSSPAPSPSGSSSSSSASPFSEDSLGNTSAENVMDLQTKSEQEISDAAVPFGYPVQEWGGLGTVRLGRCNHGRRVIMKKCWTGKDTGRRFLGCPLKDLDQQCAYVEWLDQEWPDRVQSSFKKLWRQLKLTREVHAAGHDALIEAFKVYEETSKQKTKLVFFVYILCVIILGLVVLLFKK